MLYELWCGLLFYIKVLDLGKYVLFGSIFVLRLIMGVFWVFKVIFLGFGYCFIFEFCIFYRYFRWVLMVIVKFIYSKSCWYFVWVSWEFCDN